MPGVLTPYGATTFHELAASLRMTNRRGGVGTLATLRGPFAALAVGLTRSQALMHSTSAVLRVGDRVRVGHGGVVHKY
jgi:hypothetical protein